MRIVILDDHGLFRVGLEHLLRNLDPSLVIDNLASVAELEQLAITKPTVDPAIDLVLLDYHLPGAGAEQNIATVRAALPKSKIVVVSAETDPHKIVQVIDLGACGFIPKSADPDLLSAALTLVMAGGVFLPSSLSNHYKTLASSSLKTPNKSSADLSTQRTTSAIDNLSPRQLDTLKLAIDGLSNQEIAESLNISVDTVKAHLSQAYKTLGVSSRTQAVLCWHEHTLSV